MRNAVRRRGFSIVEIFMVLIIMTGVLLIGIPYFGRSQANTALRLAARELQVDMDLARSCAMGGAADSQFEYAVPAATSASYTVKDSAGVTKKSVRLPDQITVDYSGLAGGPDLIFHANGGATASGDITIRHSKTNKFFTINLNGATGMTRMTEN